MPTRHIEIEDLFTGGNPEGISGSDAEFVARVEHMINSLPYNLQGQVRIISGYRSFEEQQRLYDDYLNGTGNLAAPPGRSNHNHGLAMDLTFDSWAARQWFHAHAGRFGLDFPIASEDWHIEPRGLRDGTYRSQPTPESDEADEMSLADQITAAAEAALGVAVGGVAGGLTGAEQEYFDEITQEVDNTSLEVQLKRMADLAMGGQFDVMRNLRVTNALKLAEKNQEPETYV